MLFTIHEETLNSSGLTTALPATALEFALSTAPRRSICVKIRGPSAEQTFHLDGAFPQGVPTVNLVDVTDDTHLIPAVVGIHVCVESVEAFSESDAITERVTVITRYFPRVESLKQGLLANLDPLYTIIARAMNICPLGTIHTGASFWAILGFKYNTEERTDDTCPTKRTRCVWDAGFEANSESLRRSSFLSWGRPPSHPWQPSQDQTATSIESILYADLWGFLNVVWGHTMKGAEDQLIRQATRNTSAAPATLTPFRALFKPWTGPNLFPLDQE